MVSCRLGAFAAAAIASLTVGVATADAAQRYASTTGSGTACTSAAPCTVGTAVESATSGDEVIINPGTYSLAAGLTVPADASVHGAVGGPRPILSIGGGNGIGGPADISDLRIEHSGGGTGVYVSGAGHVAEDLDVASTGTVACDVNTGAIIRDSFCINNKTAVGNKYALQTTIGSGTNVGYARNITAISTGPNAYAVFVLAGAGASSTFDLRNVIASGTQADVQASAGAGATATATFANSNYDSTSVSGTTSITPFGSGTNQIDAPLFVNAVAGDYHEAATSPTINAGAADDKTGTLDIDGEARSQGTAIDIGADELTEIPPDTTPPDTFISKGPKKKAKATRAAFLFSTGEAASTYECKLDKAAYRSCTAPQKYTGLKPGKHKFSVRGSDAEGNTDPTAAVYNWTVRKPRRHHR